MEGGGEGERRREGGGERVGGRRERKREGRGKERGRGREEGWGEEGRRELRQSPPSSPFSPSASMTCPEMLW